jgi:hypothetical protein
MSFAEIANIGEFIGGIGVLCSLIFVGLQIRHNTESVRASTLQANTAYWTNFLTTVARSELVDTFGKGMSGSVNLDRKELGQFFLLSRAYFLGLENQHYQYAHGLLDSEKFAAYEIAVREQTFAFPGIRAMWEIVRHTYSPDFVAFVDRQIAMIAVHQDSVFDRWRTLAAALKAAGGTRTT